MKRANSDPIRCGRCRVPFGWLHVLLRSSRRSSEPRWSFISPASGAESLPLLSMAINPADRPAGCPGMRLLHAPAAGCKLACAACRPTCIGAYGGLSGQQGDVHFLLSPLSLLYLKLSQFPAYRNTCVDNAAVTVMRAARQFLFDRC